MGTYNKSVSAVVSSDGLYYGYFAVVSNGTTITSQSLEFEVNGVPIPDPDPGQYIALSAGDSITVYGEAEFDGPDPALCLAQHIVELDEPQSLP